MEIISLSLILDGIIMVLLIATIAYAMRLTGYLKKFKESRADLEKIIKDLSIHINKADKAVADLNQTVDQSSADLQYRMNKANKMFNELDIVVQTGDNLANRLEEIAVRNRRIMQGAEGDVVDLMNHARGGEAPYETRLENIVKKTDEAAEGISPQVRSPFAIRDPEMEREDVPKDPGGFTIDDGDVLSDAERDLYQALQSAKNRRGGDS